MRKSPPRGGIERKFITSILWVGVIPMTLALIIGYFFAREGQWRATQQNQATAARKTAEGLWLALEGRRMLAQRIVADPALADALRDWDGRGNPPGKVNAAQLYPEMAQRLESEAALTGEPPSRFALFDVQGRCLFQTGPASLGGDPAKWVDNVKDATFVDFRYLPDENRYVTVLIAPVPDGETNAPLGFIAEMQDARDLLEFALGKAGVGQPDRRDLNNYQVIYLGDDGFRKAISLRQGSPDGALPLEYEPVDPEFIRRVNALPRKQADTFFLWRYAAMRQKRPVLLAYHRFHQDFDLFFVVYRPVSDVFANINLAAVLTLVLSGLTIGFFCIIAYRIVNNTVIRPVSLLNEGAQIIRQGDLDLKLRIHTGDEIEELANSFNNMAVALRRNLRQLVQSEEKYRSLITSMRDGIYQTDSNGVLAFLNPTAAAIFGFDDPEEAVGRSFWEMFSDPSDCARLTGELARRRFVEHVQTWVETPHGRAVCIELSANSVYADDGRLIGFEGTVRDVTRNVRLEQAARERSERISVINQITNVITSSLEPGRVYESIVSETKKLVDFEYASVALMKETETGGPDEETQMPIFVPRQMWPFMGEAGNSGLATGGALCASWVAREGRALLLNDLREDEEGAFAEEFPRGIASCLCVPLYVRGRIVGTLNLGARERSAFSRHAVEVLEQITPHVAVAIRNAELLEDLQRTLAEVTGAREELHKANEELKTLDELKTNLLSNVSHELRTPLVSVMGYTDMILNEKSGPINETQREYLTISLRNVEKLVTLIENLLDFSRMHRGAEEMVYDTMDLTECARSSMQIVRPVADSRNIELALDAPAGGRRHAPRACWSRATKENSGRSSTTCSRMR